MTVPYAFSAATSAIPLSQLDANFNTTITLGNTAIQLGNTVTTLNNMTLANVTISSGNVTLTNVTVTTANATTVNTTTLIATTANVTTVNATNINVATTSILNYGTVNGVAYLNASKALTTGSALTFDGTNLGLNCTATNFGANYRTIEAKSASATTSGIFRASSSDASQKIDLFIDAGVGTLRTDSNHPLAFSLNNSEQMRLTSTGLGIGITNPANKLVVSNAGANGLEVNPTSGVSSGASLNGYNRSTSAFTPLTYTALAHYFQVGSSPLTVATLDSSGNLGLGVTPSTWSQGRAIELINPGYGFWNGSGSPASMYMLANAYFNSGFKYGGTGEASSYYQYQGAHVWSTAASGTAGNAITFTQAMTLDASGKLQLNATSTAGGYFTLNTLSQAGLDIYRSDTTANYNGIRFRNTTNTATYASLGWDSLGLRLDGDAGLIVLSTSGTERARIDSSGNLLVQAISSSVTSDVGHKIRPDAAAPFMATVGSSTSGGDVTYSLYSTGAAAYRFYVGYNGTISATTTTISGISDVRLKENIRDLDDGLAAVMALKPRKFDWKAGKGKDIKDDRGFIAQEFEQVFPDMIDEWKDPAPEGEEPYKSVRADLIPVLVKALQELKAEFDAYKATHP